MKISEFTNLEENFELSILFSELGPFKQAFEEINVPWINPQQVKLSTIASRQTGRFPGLYFIVAPALPGYEQLIKQLAPNEPLPNWGNSTANNSKEETIIPLYIGISADKIFKRFETHQMKALQDFKSLLKITRLNADQLKQLANGNTDILTSVRRDYGDYWKNPGNWRKFLNLFLSGDPREIPEHFKQSFDAQGKPILDHKGRKLYEPNIQALNQYNPNWFNQQESLPGRDPSNLPVLVWNLDKLSKKSIEFIEDYVISIYKPLFNNTAEKNVSLQQVMLEKPNPNEVYKQIVQKQSKIT